MSEGADELATRLEGLPLSKRAKYLNLLSYHLTISARSAIIDESEPRSRMIGFNELQHQLIQQIGHYLNGETVKVYPVDVFCAIIFEKANYYGISRDLKQAIGFAERLSK